MQITETVSEGLRREYTVVVGASDLEQRLTGKLEEIKPRLCPQGLSAGQGPRLVPEKDLRQVDDGRDRRGRGQ